MARAAWALLLAGALGLVGCGRGDNGGKESAGPTVRVSVEAAALSQLDETYQAVGTVASKTASTLASKIVGSVVAVNAVPGDAVTAGQVLVQIDDRDVVAQVAAAKAGLAAAERGLQELQWTSRTAESAKAAADAQLTLAASTYERMSGLIKSATITRQQFDETQAKYDTAKADARRADETLHSLRAREAQAAARTDQARAEVADAEARFSYTRIGAPYAGLVTAKNVQVGDMAVVGVPLLTVEDNRNYRLEALLGESYLSRVKLGDKVPVTIDALGGQTLEGRVGEIVPQSDTQSHSFLVKLDLPAVQGLRSGQFGRAAFTTGQREAVTVPASAVVEHGQLTAVYVVDGQGIAHLRLVTLGKAHGDRVEVLSGLTQGELVVAHKAGRLREGSRVEPRG